MRWYPFISSRAFQEVFTGGLNLTLGSCLNQRHFYCGAANRPVFNHNYKLLFCERLHAKKPVSTGWTALEHAAAMPHPLRLDSRLISYFSGADGFMLAQCQARNGLNGHRDTGRSPSSATGAAGPFQNNPRLYPAV